MNPGEISINDADYYNTVYVGGSVRRTNAHAAFGTGLGFEGEYMASTAPWRRPCRVGLLTVLQHRLPRPDG